MTRITFQDFRACGICLDARVLFFKPHGLDWRRFTREGMSADELRGPGQHLDKIDRLEAAALLREAAHG